MDALSIPIVDVNLDQMSYRAAAVRFSEGTRLLLPAEATKLPSGCQATTVLPWPWYSGGSVNNLRTESVRLLERRQCVATASLQLKN